jgi:hypothetical protein
MLTVNANAPSGARCIARLNPPGPGGSIRLPAYYSFGPGLEPFWHHRLSRQTRLGSWEVTVACSKGGSASRGFKVGPRPAPASIRVVKSGFSASADIGGGEAITCGVELRNVTRSDARNIVVTVTFTDTKGRSLASNQTYLALIPAHQTFFMSCAQQTSVTLTVASLRVKVKVGRSTAHTGKLPVVSSLTLTPNGDGLTQMLSGKLMNPYKTPLSQSAIIYSVYYDTGGHIIGGDQVYTGAAVQPKATVSFGFPYVDLNVASAKVSVDPCGYLFGFTPAYCKLP